MRFATVAEIDHFSQMHRTRRPTSRHAIVALCLVLGVPACDKSGRGRGTTATTAGGEASTRPPRLSRPEIACRLHSCAPPYYCNQEKGICELLTCVHSRDCPYGYTCDAAEKVCR
jgi:hypothetical protein